MIEDPELRELFRIESGEHLQRLSEGLLRLEEAPDDKTALEEVFRRVHSLKGASRMLGLPDIQSVAHHFEDILGKAARDEISLSSAIIDVMYHCLDAVKKLVNEALTGEASGVSVVDVLSLLKQETPLCGKKSPTEDHPMPEDAVPEHNTDQDPPSGGEAERRPSPSPVAEDLSPSASFPARTHNDPFVIETVRVETRKLDLLMTQAGELVVAKLRIAQRLAEMEEIIGKWEALAGEIRGSRTRSGDLQAVAGRFAPFLERLKSALYDDSARLDSVVAILDEEIRAIRLLPLATVFTLFPRMVREISREQAKEAHLIVEGGETTADKHILEEMKDPLMHIIRNAIDHGIETPVERERGGKLRMGTIRLTAARTPANIIIEVADDGRGLDTEAIRRSARKIHRWRDEELDAMPLEEVRSLIFVSGLSTSSFVSDLSGRGVGLDVVRRNVERLKGEVAVESAPGGGCTIRIKLPITLATARVLIVSAGSVRYALPVEYVVKSYPLPKREIFTIEGHKAVIFDNRAISVVRLAELLKIRRTDFAAGSGATEQIEIIREEETVPCIIIDAGDERIGLLVDELLDEQEFVLKPQSSIMTHIRDISGATILGTGEVCMVLNPREIAVTLRRRGGQVSHDAPIEEAERKRIILLAEDSITTRTQMKRILDGAGYEVVAAVDGADAFARLGTCSFDAIVSDICMPNMDGLTLTRKVRQEKKYSELPVILVTMLASDEDKRKGLEAGANAYITKPAFDQKLLLDTLRRLV